jgi:hypothetical protein
VGAINAGDADRLTELADPDVGYILYLAALAGKAGAYRGHHVIASTSTISRRCGANTGLRSMGFETSETRC